MTHPTLSTNALITGQTVSSSIVGAIPPMVQFHDTTTVGARMKPLDQWTQADLEALLGTPEGLTVEFKQSDSLIFKGDSETVNKRRNELMKDVSGMANAAGGRIFYGIVESRPEGIAERLDDGLPVDVKPEQINDLLTSNIAPSIRGLTVHAVPLAGGNRAIVIDIPQATTLAPHQSRLHRQYFQRFDKKAEPLFDHQIRDLMRRAEDPSITAKMEESFRDADGTTYFWISLANVSTAMVKYFTVSFTHYGKMEFIQPATPWVQSVGTVEDPDGRWSGPSFHTNHTPNTHIPLFQGQVYPLIQLKVPLGPQEYRRFRVKVAAPGFVGEWAGNINTLYSRVMWDFKPIQAETTTT